MSIVSSRGPHIRAAVAAAATAVAVAVVPSPALADGGGPVSPTGSGSQASPTIAGEFRDSLSVGTPVFTGAYKTIVSGPHVTKVKVYKRSFHACDGQVGGLIQNCMSGTIVYAAGFAACFSGCTVGGQQGSQHCQADGSDSNVVTSDLAACWNTLLSNGYASKAVETDRDCMPPAGCSTYSWHLNAYPTGNITGPYSGEGVA